MPSDREIENAILKEGRERPLPKRRLTRLLTAIATRLGLPDPKAIAKRLVRRREG